MPKTTKPVKRPESTAMGHVGTRVGDGVVERLDALAIVIAPIGTKPSRSTAVRACILTGLEVLEAQHAKGRKP